MNDYIGKFVPLVPTCFPGGLLCKVSCKLLEDFGHLLLHKKANEVGGRVELQRQWAGKATPPLLDGGLQGVAQGFHFVVCTLGDSRENVLFFLWKNRLWMIIIMTQEDTRFS